MVTAISDDLFTGAVVADPYTYFAQLRQEGPVHWNELYELWVVTRYDDLIWVTRHPELFSSAWWKNDARP
ncbi:MAG: cytochrome P450, partial [Chloroflexota bacterium]